MTNDATKSGDIQRPKVLIAHWPGIAAFTPEDRATLDAVADVVNTEPLGSWDDPAAGDLLAEADVLLGHWGCPHVDAALLARAPSLRLFAYAAGTIKGTIDPAVFDLGLRVTSGANANAEPVAEFTLAAILMANKDMIWARDRLRDPSIDGKRQTGDVPIGNYDKTIGIVSASIIGRRVIELLTPFPTLRPVLFDPFVSAGQAEAMGARLVELDELCATSDIVSIHAPLLPETVNLIGASQLATMRTGATLINTARGPIVDHDALRAELVAGRLYAFLDVTEPEPLPDDDPMRALPNVFYTPHQAGSQGSELRRMAAYAIDEIARFGAGDAQLNEITAARLALLA